MSKPDIAKSYAALADLAGDGTITIGASGPGMPPTEVTLTADMAPKFRQIAKRLRDMPADAQKGATPMVTAEKPKTVTHTLVRGDAPDALYHVPNVIDLGDEFGDANDIERIANALIASADHGLSHLRDVSIGYLWKSKGGKSKGRPTLAKTVKPSGITAYLTDFAFIVWVAADNVDAAALTNWQVEALVYHELSSIRVAETDDEDAEETLAIVGPDVQENFDVMRLYGDWNASLQRAQDELQARMDLP
jgi:hypothetical protein